jgi:hypothetical protein
LNVTLEALQRLTAESRVISERAATVPVMNVQRSCEQLAAAVNTLRQKRTIVTVDRPKMDVGKAWSAFVESGCELDNIDGLLFRTLCCAEKTAVRPEFVGALTRHPEKLTRSRCLYGLVNSYFSEWRTMPEPSRLESLLLSTFTALSGKNPVARKWLETPQLFSESAASFLAEEISASQTAVDDVLRSNNINAVTKLAGAVRLSVVQTACEYLRRQESSRSDEWVLSFLQWMTEKVLSDVTPPDVFRSAISSLILSESAKRSEAFQHALRSYIQNHKRLGDPRIRECSPNWSSMPTEAAQRYLSWLARDSIIFFFNTILPNNSENCRRKDFWLRYHDRIKDFQVAVSDADLWKLKASGKSSERLLYSQVIHPTTSAFLMQFEGYGGSYVVVEFSETGNAAYIFRMADFEAKRLSLRSPKFQLSAHLKFDTKHRILHTHGWEARAAHKLAYEFGIHP